MNNFKYYILFNPELKYLNYNELKKEYIKDLQTKYRITCIEDFFKKYPSFDINIFKENNHEMAHLNTIEIVSHYHKSKQIKLAHVFVHLFKIGGGEAYVQKFNKYNKFNTIFNETLFINSQYNSNNSNNLNNDTLFNYNMPIIYYNNYEELNILLKEFNIIIDHQLYWFDIDITQKSFLNIPNNKIIRIIHGVPIHFENIINYNFYYSIELYTEKESHNSWNNHIKIYNNIGINIPSKVDRKIYDKNYINIALIGRINDHKIPYIFLQILKKFTNINKKYIFNFYGDIDDSYSKIFLYNINNKTTIYHGIIHPDNIKNIYINNDILLHPSKSEAGATVILEAMSYGLPIICRNTNAMINAVVNESDNYLCNSENEMFEKLLLVNNNFSQSNIDKVVQYNNEHLQYVSLIDEIKLIYEIECIKDEIPNIIHYIFGLEEQKEEFLFVYYLSIYSNYIINKPKIIYFHYQYMPYGYWWEKAKEYIKLNYINTDNIYWGKKKIIKFAHKADKIRLDILLKYGGIYMDIDTITYQSYNHLLKYDFVIGIQEENYGKYGITLYCNAILLARKNNIFIKKWISEYEKYFIPTGWCEASVHLPHIIFNNLTNFTNLNIKILEKECLYIPTYTETHNIFENENNIEINKELLTLHLWNTYSYKYFKNINNFNWCENNNTLYAKIMRKLIINISTL